MIITCLLKRVTTEHCQVEIEVPDLPASKRYLEDLEVLFEHAAMRALELEAAGGLTADWELDEQEITVEDTV